MKKRFRNGLLGGFALALGLAAAPGFAEIAAADMRQQLATTSQAFNRAIRDADRLVVYEGLPHQTAEPESFLQERAKEVFTTGGYYFYQKPLAVSDADLVSLDHALRIHPVQVPWRGVHFCLPEFHPDYAVEWRLKDVRVGIILLCFGCGEAHLIADNISLEADLPKAGYDLLLSILRKYRSQRPKFNPKKLQVKPTIVAPPAKIELKP